MKSDINNTKIFHSIIQDLTDMIEKLRIENQNIDDLIMDKQKLNNKIKDLIYEVEEYKSKMYFTRVAMYVMITSSLFVSFF
tara:strand:+ start:606 stop:848 length:243 start_codon:yes stop_codon:yes gene_type:complete